MAKLSAFVDDIEKVDESFRDLYVKDGDRFRLDADGVEDVTALKNSMQNAKREKEEARKRLQEAQARLEALPEDFDPEEYQRLREAQKRAAEEEAEKKGEWDKLKQSLQESHQRDLAKKEEQIGTMRRTLEANLVDAAAAAAIAEAKGSVKLLLPHIKANTSVVEEGGKYVVRVMESDGQTPRVVDGRHMTIQDLVAEMKQSDDFGRAFEASGASGSGSQSNGSSNGAGALGKKKASEMSAEEKAEFMTTHGHDAWVEKVNADYRQSKAS